MGGMFPHSLPGAGRAFSVHSIALNLGVIVGSSSAGYLAQQFGWRWGFVVFGGLLALRWPRATWFHLPAAVWGAGIEFFQGICPLTPLENHLRGLGGEGGYAGGFVEHAKVYDQHMIEFLNLK